MFDKCLFVLRNLSSLLERLCALRSRVFDRFFEAAEIAKFTSREFGEHWENLKSFRDWYSVMSTQLKKGREEDLKEGLLKMKQVGIASDVNCPSYRFIGSGNNVSLSFFLEKLTS